MCPNSYLALQGHDLVKFLEQMTFQILTKKRENLLK